MTSTYIATLADTVRSIPSAEEVWCVFDNTASGAAIENAWELRERLTVDSGALRSVPGRTAKRDGKETQASGLD